MYRLSTAIRSKALADALVDFASEVNRIHEMGYDAQSAELNPTYIKLIFQTGYGDNVELNAADVILDVL